MRRGIAGAIGAVAALVVWAGGAQALASQPEWYSCAKAAKVNKAFTGAYEDKACSTASPGSEGKYELVEGPGPKPKVAAKGGEVPGGSGEVFWEVALPGGAAWQWSCSAGKELGQLAAPNRIVGVTLTLKGCAFTSAGQSPGVVVLGPLSGELGYLDEAHTEVGIDLASESEPGGELAELTERTPRAARFVVRGSMIARVTGDKNSVSKVFSMSLRATEWLGETEPGYSPVTDFPAFFGGPQDILTFEQVGGGEVLTPGEHPAGLELGLKAKGPAAEVKTS